jgi:hypothetical protein
LHVSLIKDLIIYFDNIQEDVLCSKNIKIINESRAKLKIYRNKNYEPRLAILFRHVSIIVQLVRMVARAFRLLVAFL